MNEIKAFIESRPSLSVMHLEKEAGCPGNTLRNFLYGYRSIPLRHLNKVVVVLCRYGFRPYGWELEYDEAIKVWTAQKPIPERDIESIYNEEGEFEYSILHFRQLIGDAGELKEFLTKKNN